MISNLQRLVYSRGMDQRTFASKLEVSQAAVSHWMNGKRLPSPKMYPIMGRILGVSATTVIDAISPPTPNA